MKVQKTLGKALNESINSRFRLNKAADFLNWIDAGSSAEVNGVAYSSGSRKLGHDAPDKRPCDPPGRRIVPCVPCTDAPPHCADWLCMCLPNLSLAW